jgi:hypothetical protein
MDNEDLPVMRQRAKTADEIADDLAVINTEDLAKPPAPPPEDLTQSPFVKPIKPKAKKPISEKQKEHLAKAREKARAMKEQKLTKAQEKVVEKVEMPQIAEEEMSEKEFEKWLKNYDRFSAMMEKIQREKAEKQAKELAKEKAIEDRLREKLEKEYAEKYSQPISAKSNNVIYTEEVDCPPPNPFSRYLN